MNATEQRAPELQWPEGYPRTTLTERESYPGDISLTRKESFQSIIEETRELAKVHGFDAKGA